MIPGPAEFQKQAEAEPWVPRPCCSLLAQTPQQPSRRLSLPLTRPPGCGALGSSRPR